MRWPLRNQILVPMICLMIGTLVSVSAINAYLSLRRTRTRIAGNLRQVAETLADSSFPLTDSVLRKMRGLSGADFVLTDRRGRVLAASAPNQSYSDLPNQRPEAAAAQTVLGEPIVIGTRHYFHVPMGLRGFGANVDELVLHILYPKEAYDEAWRVAVYPPMLLGILAVILVGVVARGIASRVTRPLRLLQSQGDEIAEGIFRPLAELHRDDEQSICWALRRLGESMGHDVITASSAEQALDAIGSQPPDAIVLDVRLPGMDGLTAIERFRERLGEVPVIIITAYGDLDTAVRAVRSGAVEYLIKPFDLEHVENVLTRAMTGPRGAACVVGGQRVEGMVGSSAALQAVFKHIALAARSDACVLLSGESGTGKELAARAIHMYSDRADGPFVAVNVASLSTPLAESELFGHVRGAFTGADVPRVGLLVQADGGTLFLDEVADIPLPVQVKLLRVLEHGHVTPVGSNDAVTSDFRIVSATHQDLMERVAAGAFRHDLYFRLCGFQIDLPPLRERAEDIRDLARHFVTGREGQPVVEISDETMAELVRRPWYGNARELRNAIEHAAILARGRTIEVEHLPPPAESRLIAGGDPDIDHRRQIVQLSRDAQVTVTSSTCSQISAAVRRSTWC